MGLDYIKTKTERNTMRLRQIWQDDKLIGLKLDRSSKDFIKLDDQLVKLFIEHVNSQIVPSPNKPFQA
jgi:hypothetical protein